jgi:hypothetical protein
MIHNKMDLTLLYQIRSKNSKIFMILINFEYYLFNFFNVFFFFFNLIYSFLIPRLLEHIIIF